MLEVGDIVIQQYSSKYSSDCISACLEGGWIYRIEKSEYYGHFCVNGTEYDKKSHRFTKVPALNTPLMKLLLGAK